MFMSEIKLIPERNVNREALKKKLIDANVIFSLYSGHIHNDGTLRIWRDKGDVPYSEIFDESDLKDMFYIINPMNFYSKEDDLFYAGIKLSWGIKKHLFRGVDTRQQIIETIDKRDDVRHEISNLFSIEVGMYALVLRELFQLRDYKLIPVPLLFFGAVVECEIVDQWGNFRGKKIDLTPEKNDKFIKNVYSYIPTDQRKLFPFAKKIMEEERKAKLEARQNKHNNPAPQED